MSNLVNRLVRRRATYLMDLRRDDPAPVAALRDPRLRLEVVDWHNVNAVGDPKLAKTFRGLLAVGDVGVYCLHGDVVVGRVWGTFSGPVRTTYWGGVEFGPNEAMLTWGRTEDGWQGAGIFRAILARLIAEVRARGNPIRILCDVPAWPLTSLRAHDKLGYRLLGRLEYVTVAKRCVHRRWTPAGPGELTRLLALAESDRQQGAGTAAPTSG